MDKLFNLERLRAQAGLVSSSSSAAAEQSVGKQTLTGSLGFEGAAAPAGAAVQKKSMWTQIPFGGGPIADVITQGAAQHGVSGGGGQLPFLDAIQRSFGAHDV